MSDLGSLFRSLTEVGVSAELANEVITLAYGAGVASVPCRSAGADRTARWRERHKASQSVTKRHSVTVKENPPDPLKKITTPKEANASFAPKGADTKRGTRLPEGFFLTEERRAYAVSKGIRPDRVEREFEKFCGHFWASSKANAVKSNWDQAWKNWVLNSLDMTPNNGRQNEPKSGGLVEAGRKRIAELAAIREERERVEAGGAGIPAGDDNVFLLSQGRSG